MFSFIYLMNDETMSLDVEFFENYLQDTYLLKTDCSMLSAFEKIVKKCE